MKGFSIFIAALLLLPCISDAQLPVMNPIAGNSTVCSVPSSPFSYTASATNAPTSYSWSASPSAGVVFSDPSGPVTAISFPNTNLFYIISCYASNASGSGNPVNKIVQVFETPTVTFSGANFFCQGSSTNISASPTLYYSASSSLSFTWSPAVGLSPLNSLNVTASPPSTTNYTLKLALGACTHEAQFPIIMNICVGVEELSNGGFSKLSAYPNPAKNMVMIRTSRETDLSIINDMGQLVRKLHLLADCETPVTGLPGGIYFIISSDSRLKIVIDR